MITLRIVLNAGAAPFCMLWLVGCCSSTSPEDIKSARQEPIRKRRIASEVLRVGRLMGEFGDHEYINNDEITTIDERHNYYPYKRIKATYRDRLEITLNSETLWILSADRPAAIEAACPIKDSINAREEAVAGAVSSVRRVYGAFPTRVLLAKTRTDYYRQGRPGVPTYWEIAWIRVFHSYRVNDQILVHWNTSAGCLSIYYNYSTIIESLDLRLTETEALQRAQSAASALVNRENAPGTNGYLQRFNLDGHLGLGDPRLNEIEPLMGLWIISPEYPFRKDFKDLYNFYRPIPRNGRLAYCFAFWLKGPKIDEHASIIDKDLLIWIDAANGDVLKVMF